MRVIHNGPFWPPMVIFGGNGSLARAPNRRNPGEAVRIEVQEGAHSIRRAQESIPFAWILGEPCSRGLSCHFGGKCAPDFICEALASVASVVQSRPFDLLVFPVSIFSRGPKRLAF